MICPKCGSERARRNGGGRGMCADCGYSGMLKFFATPEEVAEVQAGTAPEFGLYESAAIGTIMGKVTVQRNAAGEVLQTWARYSPDDALRAEAMRAAVEAMAEKIPREKPRPAPATVSGELCNVYVLTDFHLGMLSWREETGADWDANIAEAMLVDWFAAAIAQAPQADTAVFAQLGDFLHFDGLEAVTPTSRHLLDADTRFTKLVRVAIRAVRRVIGMLLVRHRHVHVLMAEGNHDMASSVWLRELLACQFEDEPRVSVDRSPDPYYCVEWGKTALFFHHGHKRRPADIDKVFAAKFREVFGRTRYAYAHMGHLHHIAAKETNLMVVEQHRTLAAPDAYAARGGWMSGRDAVVVTYHKAYGEVSRTRVSSKMLEAA